MKFVRKKDEFENDAPYLIRAYVEDTLVDGWVNLLAHEHGEAIREQLSIEDAPQCGIDGGGMVMKNEPTGTVTVGGCEFSTFLRQVEFAVPCLREASPRSQEFLGDHVWIRMKWKMLICTRTTANAVADAFEQQATERKDEIDAVWAHMDGISVSKAKLDAGASMEGKKAIAPSRAEQRERAGLDT